MISLNLNQHQLFPRPEGPSNISLTGKPVPRSGLARLVHGRAKRVAQTVTKWRSPVEAFVRAFLHSKSSSILLIPDLYIFLLLFVLRHSDHTWSSSILLITDLYIFLLLFVSRRSYHTWSSSIFLIPDLYIFLLLFVSRRSYHSWS
jgi:hypothetical protein